MLKSYLTIALRHLRRQKGYTFINVTGLAVGVACCLLIFLLVRHEWSYDTFHANAGSVYRLVVDQTEPDGTISHPVLMPPGLGEALVQDVSGVVRYVNVTGGNPELRRDDERFQRRLLLVDSTFFELFTFPLLAGDPSTALDEPGGIAVTEETARLFFGEAPPEEVVGQTLTLPRGDTAYVFTVTAVAAVPPENSSLRFDALISFANYDQITMGANDWGGRTSLYVQLEAGQDVAAFERALAPFTAAQFADRIASMRQSGYLADGADAWRLRLQPLRRLHLSPDVPVLYEQPTHNPLYSYVLSGIAVLVLFIACVNFMLLSVGRSAERAREVGMRKVLGAQRRQVMRQFWGESMLLGGVSLGLGVALAVLALPLFNELTEQRLAFRAGLVDDVLLALTGAMVFVGLVGGAYPAAVLSRFQPAAVLKGAVRSRGNSVLTRGLVVVQYTLSIALIVGTLVMARQLDYVMSRDLGFDDDHVVVVQTGNLSRREQPLVLERFREAFAGDPAVRGVARAAYAFTRGSDRNSWTDADGVPRAAYNVGIDYDFLDVMGMELAAGRNFSRERPSDPTTGVLVNEALVEAFGLDDPIGYRLTGWGDGYAETPVEIIGVVRDFNFQSLHEAVEPMVLNLHPGYYMGMNAMLVRVRPGGLATAVERIEATWKQLLPDRPFAYSFLRDDLASQYRTEQRWSRLLTYATVFAIVIACLGLFGLATLTVARRTKEIGIRKVLGATAPGVVALVSREFAVLVVVATLAACPLAYLFLQRWLEGFAYRIPLSWWLFAAAGALALAVALATVSYHAVRAALSDPVKALRYE